MSGNKEAVPVNSMPPSAGSSWPSRLRNGSGEKIKNWAAFLMGVAALITAIGTHFQPSEDPDYKIAYEAARKEIAEMSVDIKKLSSDIETLYRLRREEDTRRQVAAELERSAYEIEDHMLRRMLVTKYGEKFAKEYMEKRARLRLEIRQEYVESLERRALPMPYTPPTKRDLPDYGKKE